MGALRYADRLDADYEAGNIGTASMYKSQGEGLTFWRTIAPLVASSAPTGAALVSQLYDPARSPSTSANFCEVRAALRLALPAGITRDDMGELVGTIYHGKVCANYAPVNSVLDDARVSVTVSTIKAALVRVNFVAAKAAYIGSHLEALALTSSAGSAYADHFGEPTPYNSFFIQCVDGTGVWAGKISARLECVEKITFDAVPVQQIVLLLQKALVEATAGHRGLAQAALLVDRAYALYRGGDDLYSPFERANKRGANFYGEDDTKLVDDQLIALNNGRIEAGFVGLQAAVLLVGADYNAVAAAALEMTIVGQLQVTYVQATLRYAAQLDEQVVDGDSHLAMYENQGEGWTFWRVVSPLIALRDAAAAQLIVDRFDLDTKPTRTDFYCLALHTLVLNNLPPGVTAAHVGTLENAHGPTAPDFFRCSTYQITSTPASQLNAVQLMGELMELLPDAVDTSNWAPLRAAYVGSDLQALALADYDGEARYDAYEALYGDAWIDATILAAADGTGTFTDPSVRAEIFEKSVLDAVSVKELYHLLDKAVVDMDTDFVDAAWALYTGSAGHPLGASVFERAQKRGANYKAAGGAYLLDADGVATTNVAVLAYLESLQTAVIAHNATAAGIAQAGIESQLFVIYYQCTLRYALLLDQDNLASPQLPFAEHQGEGWAFYKTISPIIVAADAAGAATVETLYVVTGARPAGVRNYCSVKAVLDGCWPAGMIAADFDTLKDVPAGHCGTTGGGGSGGDDDGGNDSSSSDSDDDDDDDDDEATGAQNSATAAASIGGGVVAGIVIAVLVSALLVDGLLYFYNRRLKSKSQARYDDQPPPKHTAPSDKPAYYQNTHEVMVVQV
ncbi:hypothetical protein T492DRAFT_865455 [Pavlovales sp. CCMP2436]|nr:hypothetical protein T492DRAFT_865455 [Pavlovales sp. CCMP2436]